MCQQSRSWTVNGYQPKPTDNIPIPPTTGSNIVEPIRVPIWEKQCLTLEEAAELYNIGVNRLRDLTANDKCSFVLFVGNKRLIKRKQFDAYLSSAYSI